MSRILSLIFGLAFSTLLIAQTYPNRPVRIIVPWPPGQATDIAARMLAQRLQETLGQPFVIDNRPGAGGALGTEIAVRAPADGYTLLAASSGPVSIMPSLQKLSYEPLKDLVAIGLITRNPYAVVAAPNFPANNAREFIAVVRASPDKYTFASSGTGATAHLVAELFNSMAQIKARHIPYKGSAPAMTDVINGQVSYTVETVASVVGHVRSGRLKTFGVTTARRAGGMPDVPTLAEAADLKDLDIGAWIGYAAPSGVPREIVLRLSNEMHKALQENALKEKLLAAGLDPAPIPLEQLPAFMRAEQERYATVIKNANIRLE
mgnify:CR=1 FL=1|jgi:tripartite-type tricarboxylate transporter receptor subunit TctC